jgi:hypothetical protein
LHDGGISPRWRGEGSERKGESVAAGHADLTGFLHPFMPRGEGSLEAHQFPQKSIVAPVGIVSVLAAQQRIKPMICL